MKWEVKVVVEVATWLDDLQARDPKTGKRVLAAIDLLEERGPALGRPLVDRIEASAIHNMKELRPTSQQDNAIRILFVFDPERRAVLLVAGDKSGNWSDWYDDAIPLAESRYQAWINGYSVEE